MISQLKHDQPVSDERHPVPSIQAGEVSRIYEIFYLMAAGAY
jgi:hypothetical protein